MNSPRKAIAEEPWAAHPHRGNYFTHAFRNSATHVLCGSTFAQLSRVCLTPAALPVW